MWWRRRGNASVSASPPVAQGVPTLSAPKQGARVIQLRGWEGRPLAGLTVASVAPQTRYALVRALGEAGVEAEFFLTLVQSFPPSDQYSHAEGELLLLQLLAAAQRISRVAASLEVATQGYLAELARTNPEVRDASEQDEVWWSAFAGYALEGESLDLRLRRCGFAYRHVVELHLTVSVESIVEQMALTLHALHSLPPAGVVPMRSLYQGLYELSWAWQGDIVQHHLLDLGSQAPGLLTAIARLRTLDSSDDTSIESDLAWVHGQVARLRGAAPVPGRRAAGGSSVDLAALEWNETIIALEQLQPLSAPSTPTR